MFFNNKDSVQKYINGPKPDWIDDRHWKRVKDLWQDRIETGWFEQEETPPPLELNPRGFYEKDKPKSTNIFDFYSKSEAKIGEDYSRTLFFNLKSADQKRFAQWFNETRERFRERGFDVNDPDVLDICNYEAGERFLYWLSEQPETSVQKHYYYGPIKTLLDKHPGFNRAQKETLRDEFHKAYDESFDFIDFFFDLD